MAKQAGIHQLKGKVGSMSYFQMAGVQDGIVRRIPEGLSSRVKNDEVYANTRLNNEEFTRAAQLSKVAYNSVPNRLNSMFRRFAYAEMLKGVKEFIVAGTGDWGKRIPSERLDVVVRDVLENRAKFGPYDGQFGDLRMTRGAQTGIAITLTYSTAQAAAMASLGITGLLMRVQYTANGYLIGGDSPVLVGGHSNIDSSEISVDASGGDEEFAAFVPSAETLNMLPANFAQLAGSNDSGIVAVVTFLPLRSVNDKNYVLTEFATYAAIACGGVVVTP